MHSHQNEKVYMVHLIHVVRFDEIQHSKNLKKQLVG